MNLIREWNFTGAILATDREKAGILFELSFHNDSPLNRSAFALEKVQRRVV